MKHFTFPRIALFLSSLIIFLSGCASVAPKAPDTTTPWKTRERALSALNHWQLSGKIAVIAPQDSGSATVDWQQTAEQYRITLLAPLGAGGMTLTGSDHHILLKTTDGKVAEASSPEALLRENGGLNIPVSKKNKKKLFNKWQGWFFNITLWFGRAPGKCRIITWKCDKLLFKFIILCLI